MIQFVKGDATEPVGEGSKIIAHVCNDAGKWGSGFVLAISKKWPGPEKAYRGWYAEKSDAEGLSQDGPFELGAMQLIRVEDGLYVANMIAQVGTGDLNGPPIRYDALRQCLRTLGQIASGDPLSTVHVPRLGCDLAGGKWSEVEPILFEELYLNGVETTVYDFPGGRFNP